MFRAVSKVICFSFALMPALAIIAISPSSSQAKITCKYCADVNPGGAKVCKYCRTSIDYANFPVPVGLAATTFIDEMPCWGPTGKIVYINGQRGRDVTIMNADGSSPQRFPRGQDSVADRSPFWGANGKIVFSAGIAEMDIYIMDPDGSNRRAVTDLDSDETTPTMNKEGRIVFASDLEQPGDRGSNLFAINMDGSGITKLTKDGTYNYNPCWSPDGRKIAYNALVNDVSQLFTMDADGSNVRQLTKTGTNFDPSWGPDGRIAFTSERDDKKGEIYLMKPDGTGERRLTWNVWRDARPSLGAEGKLVFESQPNRGPLERKGISIVFIRVK